MQLFPPSNVYAIQKKYKKKRRGVTGQKRNASKCGGREEQVEGEKITTNSHEVRPHSVLSYRSAANPFFRNSFPLLLDTT